MKRRVEGNLREGEGHQSTTNHYKVQNVPQIAEVGSLVKKQAKHHHLEDMDHAQYSTNILAMHKYTLVSHNIRNTDWHTE